MDGSQAPLRAARASGEPGDAGPGRAEGVALDRVTSQVSARLGSAAISDVSDVTVTVDVPAHRWIEALSFARDDLGCDSFDWLSALDELADGFAIVVHVYGPAGSPHLLLRTRVAAGTPHLPTATTVYDAAASYERRTAARFGVVFDGHPYPVPLLAEGLDDHPPGEPP